MHGLSRRSTIRLILMTAASPFAGSITSFAGDAPPLAIKGFDPVAYFTVGRPVRGLPEIEFEWDEYRYRFSTPEHRALFKADPVRYAPQFANFCAMALTRGEVDEANPQYWLISQGKLYLFGKPVGPALFRRGLAENVAKANQNRGRIQKP